MTMVCNYQKLTKISQFPCIINKKIVRIFNFRLSINLNLHETTSLSSLVILRSTEKDMYFSVLICTTYVMLCYVM